MTEERKKAFYAAECLIQAAQYICKACGDPFNAVLESALEETKKAHTAWHEENWDHARNHGSLALSRVATAAEFGTGCSAMEKEQKLILKIAEKQLLAATRNYSL